MGSFVFRHPRKACIHKSPTEIQSYSYSHFRKDCKLGNLTGKVQALRRIDAHPNSLTPQNDRCELLEEPNMPNTLCGKLPSIGSLLP